MSNSHQKLLIGLGLAVASICATLLLHFPSLRGYFQADDFVWLYHSDMTSLLTSLHGSWGLGTAYRPLARLSYALDWYLFGANASCWHAVNLLVHAANGILVAVIARTLKWDWTKALTVTLLFLSFPMDWETVDWVSGRTGLLAMLFSLLSFQTWLWQAVQRRNCGRAILWMTLFQVLGLMCYEPVLILPLVFLCAALPLAQAGVVRTDAVVITASFSCATAAAFWAIRCWILGTSAVNTDASNPNFLSGALHDVLALFVHSWRDLTPYLFLILLAILIVGLVRRATRNAVLYLSAGAAIAYAPFLGVAGFTERFSYLASAPLLFAVTLSMSVLRSGAYTALAAIIVVSFGVLSEWQSNQMRLAGMQVERIIAGLHLLTGLEGNVLFEDVPDEYRGKYLLMGAFEEVAKRQIPTLKLIGRTQVVARQPGLAAAFALGRVSLVRYDSISGKFVLVPFPFKIPAPNATPRKK